MLADAFAATSWPGELRRQQAAALDALSAAWATGRRRAWLALPPGAGKTLVGLEAARRLARRTVIFGPNTAIQAQWIKEWSSFRPATVPAGDHRTLQAPVTALTYQSLAVFDPDAEVDEEGHATVAPVPAAVGARRRRGLLARLHANGQALVDALHDAGPVTLILDEAHHLLEVWGALLAELLDLLPDASVIGLTATPPTTLTSDQAELVDRLFGHPIYSASVPSLVKDGYLAPFAELAWLVTPTPQEDAWLGAEAERFTELRTDLMNPDFATVGLFEWLDRRFVERAGPHGAPISWFKLERADPDLATAILRLHVAGLVGLPDGAVVREEHRREPSAADWVCVLDDYVRRFLRASPDPVDAAALERIRRVLPSLGYRLTKHGIRTGRSPVDRVIARSEAKTHGGVEIIAWESATLGERLRALVLCDHERASATLPARLVGVLDADAGSARLMLENLLADPRTAALNPMLVTGSTVAASPSTARDFVAWAADHVDLQPVPGGDGVVELEGSWSSRTWVPLVTRYFESGRCRVLVGTRALLGEGWNAPIVNTLVDLTTATTPTAVVQTRGRALRTDPSWPDKVATNWSVVCLSESHPGGSADWDRFVRKHTGYLAVDTWGEIVDGVAHVDDQFSPYKPSPAAQFDTLNAQMLERSTNLPQIRESWRVGEPYDDSFAHELRVVVTPPSPGQPRPRAEPSAPATPPVAVPTDAGIAPAATMTGRWQQSFDRRWMVGVRPPGLTIIILLTAAAALLPASGAAGGMAAFLTVAVLWAASALAVVTHHRALVARAAGRLLWETAAEPADLGSMARAVADAMRAAGLSPVGAEAVRIDLDRSGTYRARLGGVPVDVSEAFVAALDEVLAPLSSPRYVIPRYILAPPSNLRRAGRAWLSGRPSRTPPSTMLCRSNSLPMRPALVPLREPGRVG